MNQALDFQVGDRINTKYWLSGLPAGSCGTVQSVFVSVRGVYDVLLERDQTRRVMYESDLTLIPPAQQTVGP